ncbi:MAG: hypothetical protein QOH61_827 [Chloroflexota bacterium]|jgi:hypothetical protein|nr:hypothetical protein [Chloroflexota bacterium]
MDTVLPLVSRRVPQIVALLILAAIVVCGLALLAYVVALSAGTDLPRLDGPQMAPFRWTDLPMGLG